MQLLNVNTLSQRTGIAATKLIYCIENGMTERDWLLPEHDTQMLDIIAAVHVVCGALLIDSGCSPLAAKLLMKAIAGFQRQRRNPLNLPPIAEAINGTDAAVVQVADGTHVRWRIGIRDSGWFRFTPKKESEPDHVPTLVIAMDVARIRDMIRGA